MADEDLKKYLTGLDELQRYAAQMQGLKSQPTVVNPGVDRWDPIAQYAKANGLVPPDAPPTIIDPTVDHFQGLAPVAASAAEAGQQGQPTDPTDASAAEGAARLMLSAGIPGLPDTSMFAPGVAAPPPGVGGAAPGAVPTGKLGTMGPSWAPAAPPPGAPSSVDPGIPDVGPITITRGDPRSHSGAMPPTPWADAAQRDAATSTSPVGKPGFDPTVDAGAAQASPDELDAPGAPARPPVLFGPTGGAFIPPRQIDTLNPLGNTPENRTEFDEGQNALYQANKLKNTNLEVNTSDRLAAIDAQAARAQQAYAEQRAMLEGQLKASADHQAAMQNAKGWADTAADAAMKEAQDAKVDQGHFFASRGAGQQVALIIGAALGALGSSLTNTPNYALQMIQGAMADDMQAQQANLSNKRASADSALKKAMTVTGDLDSAKALVRLQQLQVAQNTIDSYAKMDLADEQKAKLMEIHDGLKAQIMEEKGNLMSRRAITETQLHPVVGGGYVGGGVGGNGTDPDAIKGALRVPDGKGGWADYSTVNMTGDREPLVESAVGLSNLQDLGAQIDQIAAKGRLARALNPQDKAQLLSLQKQVVQSIKTRQDGSDADAERLQAMAGDYDAWTSDGSMVLRRFIANRSAQLRNAINVRGAEPIVRGYNVNPRTGARTPAAAYTGQSPDAGTMPKPIK